MADKKLLFSITKDDLKFETSRGSGKGGQNRNKRDTKVKVIHPESGATGECQEERSQEQNKKRAFRRMVESQKFINFIRMKAAAVIEGFRSVEAKINAWLHPNNLKLEHVITYRCDGCRAIAQVITPEGNELLPPIGWSEYRGSDLLHYCEKCTKQR